MFWSIKNSGEVLNKLKSRGFRATRLSTYDFSTLYTTLPHNLINEKLINLIEWNFKREGSLILPVTKDRLSSLLETQNHIKFGLVKPCMKSKKISNDQELIQSDPISCPQNQKGNN